MIDKLFESLYGLYGFMYFFPTTEVSSGYIGVEERFFY